MIPLSRRSPVPPKDCNLAKSIDLIGDRWTLLILRSAMFGLRRFDDFQTELGIPRTVLSGRLKALIDGGVMAKQSYKAEGKRARPEYILTEMGEALQPALMALMQWGDSQFADGDGPMSFSHKTHRGKVRTGYVDDAGREVLPHQLRIAIRR